MKPVSPANKSSYVKTSPITESLDERMIALMRLVLTSAGLIVIFLDPAEPDRFVPATYAALVLYVAYSLACF